MMHTHHTLRTRGVAAIRRGFTLIEMVVTLVIFGVVMTAAFNFFTSESRSFRDISDRSALVQSLRFGRDLLRQEIRTAGTNVTEDQPLIVYANDSVFSFNADLTTNIEDSVRLTGAVYVDRFAQNAAVSALRLTDAAPIPGSDPAFTYPLQDYSQNPSVFINSDAETVTFWFTQDTSTVTTGDYVLYRRTNTQPAEVILRSVRRNAGQPFFRYWHDPTRFTGVASPLDTIPRNWLPLNKDVMRRSMSTDTGTAESLRIDQLRAVEVNYEVVSAQNNSAPRTKLVNYMVPMPNIARPRMSRACGRAPILGTGLTASWQAAAPAGIELTWAAAVDQGGGENDVIRYVIWRRIFGSSNWGEPHITIGVSGPSYTWRDASVAPGTRYEYSVAVQDCTPTLSGMAVSNGVLVP